MSRNFDGVAGGGADQIDLGDIATARFLKDNTWSVLAFFRVENTADDDRAIVAKWPDAANAKQFFWRIRSGAAPQLLRVADNGGTVASTGSQVQLDTWYLGAVTNDGSGGVGGCNIYLVGMNGTVLTSGNGDFTADAAVATTPITIGVRDDEKDVMDGDEAYVAYFDIEFTQQQILEYLHQPARVVARYAANCEFFLPLGLSSPEVDWSGAGQSGVVTGTTISDMPPVIGPLYGFDTYAPAGVPAVAAAIMNQIQFANLGADLYDGVLIQ